MRAAIPVLAALISLLLADSATAANYPWTAEEKATTSGLNTATIDGEGQCEVTAVYFEYTSSPDGLKKVKVDPSEYTVEDGKNKPVIRFRRAIPSGHKVIVDGETPNKPKKGNQHKFTMKLTKV